MCYTVYYPKCLSKWDVSEKVKTPAWCAYRGSESPIIIAGYARICCLSCFLTTDYSLSPTWIIPPTHTFSFVVVVASRYTPLVSIRCPVNLSSKHSKKNKINLCGTHYLFILYSVWIMFGCTFTSLTPFECFHPAISSYCVKLTKNKVLFQLCIHQQHVHVAMAIPFMFCTYRTMLIGWKIFFSSTEALLKTNTNVCIRVFNHLCTSFGPWRHRADFLSIWATQC